MFVLDTKLEHTAVTEANKLGLPLVAVVDTNCDPDLVDYVIPGNDDAIRAGDLMCRVISDAVAEGHYIRSKRAEAAGVPEAKSTNAPQMSRLLSMQRRPRLVLPLPLPPPSARLVLPLRPRHLRPRQQLRRLKRPQPRQPRRPRPPQPR